MLPPICDPSLFVCPYDGGGGPGGVVIDACGPDGTLQCGGCPYTGGCDGPAVDSSGGPYCIVSDCSQVIARFVPGMWNDDPSGANLSCVFDTNVGSLNCQSAANGNGNWPPPQDLFFGFYARPGLVQLLCNAWNQNANYVASGWSSVDRIIFWDQGTVPANNTLSLSGTISTILPNRAGIGVLYFSRSNPRATAHCAHAADVQP